MVIATRVDPFLAEAERLGRGLADGALRSGGRATWLADETVEVDGRWSRVVATLGPDLATGTAGVGWVLCRLAALTGDEATSGAGSGALRHSLDLAPGLVRAGRLDWFAGASGIAWAAVDAGRALESAELEGAGAALGADVVARARTDGGGGAGTALVGGGSGIVAGLLALGRAAAPGEGQAAAGARAAELAEAVTALAPRPREPGLARGVAGAGLVLAAAASTLGDAACRDAARHVFAAGADDLANARHGRVPSAHPWSPGSAGPARSWCAGGAGMGIARLAANAVLREPAVRAQADAAIEVVRDGLAADGPDTCLCHGTTGALELLLSAFELLGDPGHLTAARDAGSAMTGRARARGGYGLGEDGGAHNPSLLLGLAGPVALLVRLHDPDLLPSPALPPILPPPSGTRDPAAP